MFFLGVLCLQKCQQQFLSACWVRATTSALLRTLRPNSWYLIFAFECFAMLLQYFEQNKSSKSGSKAAIQTILSHKYKQTAISRIIWSFTISGMLQVGQVLWRGSKLGITTTYFCSGFDYPVTKKIIFFVKYWLSYSNKPLDKLPNWHFELCWNIN